MITWSFEQAARARSGLLTRLPGAVLSIALPFSPLHVHAWEADITPVVDGPEHLLAVCQVRCGQFRSGHTNLLFSHCFLAVKLSHTCCTPPNMSLTSAVRQHHSNV